MNTWELTIHIYIIHIIYYGSIVPYFMYPFVVVAEAINSMGFVVSHATAWDGSSSGEPMGSECLKLGDTLPMDPVVPS